MDETSWRSFINSIGGALAVTLLVCSVPIIILRLIRMFTHDTAFSQKAARFISIIWGVASSAIFAVIVYFGGGAFRVAPIFLWSFVNYLILRMGEKPDNNDTDDSDNNNN